MGLFSPCWFFCSPIFFSMMTMYEFYRPKRAVCLFICLTNIFNSSPALFSHKSPNQPEKSQVVWIWKCSKPFSIFMPSSTTILPLCQNCNHSHVFHLPKSNPSNSVTPFLPVFSLPTFYTNTKSRPSPAHT